MDGMSRRDMLGSAAVVGGWMLAGAGLALGQEKQPEKQDKPAEQPKAQPPEAEGPYRLSPLPYGYADLEPHIDAQTMKLHHDVHHAGYVKGANAALRDLEQIRKTGEEAVTRVRAATDALSFNLSGHILHEIFWTSMRKEGGGDPPAGMQVAKLIARDFGSMDGFRANLAAAAAQVQGSGWGVLVYEPVAQRLLILQAEKHQNTSVWGAVPLLALDVWEHAYYLKYQNKRTDFIKAFMQVINWESVELRLAAAVKLTPPSA
jgi:superoxide dismutase, Fe-Mn family